MFQCKPDHKPAKNELKVAATPAIFTLLQEELKVFESYYGAQIDLKAINEKSLIQLFNNDSIDFILMPRKPKSEELKAASDNLRILQFCHSAISIIGDSANDMNISLAELQSIVENKAKDKRFLVIREEDIDLLKVMEEKLKCKISTKKIFALPEGNNMQQYVLSNKNSIGLLDFSGNKGMNLNQQSLIKKVKSKSDGNVSTYPSQSSIADGSYPLTRTYYIIFRLKNRGMAGAFSTFLLSQTGQKIVLKAGLVPANMPQREIRILRE